MIQKHAKMTTKIYDNSLREKTVLNKDEAKCITCYIEIELPLPHKLMLCAIWAQARI